MPVRVPGSKRSGFSGTSSDLPRGKWNGTCRLAQGRMAIRRIQEDYLYRMERNSSVVQSTIYAAEIRIPSNELECLAIGWPMATQMAPATSSIYV